MTWWDTPAWHAYEVAYGDQPGTRSALLQSASWSTQVLDLTQDEKLLWQGLRKSYKSLIHQAEKRGTLLFLREDAIGVMQYIHAAVAGRVTRSAETWRLMGEWLTAGQGLAIGYASRSTIDAYAYFIVRNDWAYYASAASVELDVNHALIWEAIKALKSRGVKTLELGWQGEATDDKGQRIEFFRRGFGGKTVPLAVL